MDPVELNNVWGWLGPVLAAPFAGSFLGVLVVRLPQGEGAWRGVVTGRSSCDACGHLLESRDLVPILSFLALRGHCRFCAAPIARAHLWVELGALSVACCAAAFGARDGLLWAGCALGWALLALGWIDAVCLRLPDMLTLPLILGGLAEAAWLEPEAVTDRAAGAAAGYISFRVLAWAYRRLRGREGLGQGDAKLLAAAGAWVGVAALPLVLLAASLAGLAWALRRGEPDFQARLPFGPFLAVGIWLVWLAG